MKNRILKVIKERLARLEFKKQEYILDLREATSRKEENVLRVEMLEVTSLISLNKELKLELTVER